MIRLRWLVLSLALASCGSQLCEGCAEVAPTPSVYGTNGPFHAVASPARLPAGRTVHLSLRVDGPIQYEATCVQTLQIWAEDSHGQTIWSLPIPQYDCVGITFRTVPAGESATFKADWPTSSQLAPEGYTLHGLFLTVLPPGAMRVRENLPPLTIQIVG
jgi:hypothetical protein